MQLLCMPASFTFVATFSTHSAGMAPRYPLYQRIALMQLVHQLLADPLLMYHLFATYDLSAERKLHAVQARIDAWMSSVGASMLVQCR